MAKPEIRLKGFEGEWENHKIGELSNILTGYPFEGSSIMEKGKYLLMRGINITEGFIRHSNDIDRYFDGDISSLKKYELRTNDLVIGMDGSKVGKNSALVTERENGSLLVQRVARLRNNNINISRLIQIALRSAKFIQYVEEIKTSSAIPHISPSDIYNFEISLSNNSEEQRSVANYFSSLDSMLQSTTKKIESLKQVKQACLVSMFPQAGETTPRVRFKGFEGEWEDVSFKDISYLAGTKNRDNLLLESYSISNEFGFIPQNEQFENGGTMSNADKRMYYIVTPDSFAYNPARINVGSIGYDDLDKDVIVSSLYVVFKTDDNTHNPFLNYWFKTPMFKKMIELYQEGGVRLYFFYDKLCSCHFRRPSLKEQQRIASYFRSLDKQISLQEKRLEKLKQIKAACLDKMFV